MSYSIRDKKLRLHVATRAKNCCEYCLLPDFLQHLSFHLDHIISEKLGGKATSENLAYSCPDCNQNKGAGIVSYDFDKEMAIRFYHPRKDKWFEHFELSVKGLLLPKTDIADGTIRILKLNDGHLVEQREKLIPFGVLLV